MKNYKSPTTRRDFIKKSAASTLGFTFIPAYLTSARAQDNPKRPPSQRINLGCIGVGGRAAGVIPSLTNDGYAEPIAFCDVDFSDLNKRDRNLNAWPKMPRFNDFRKMMDKMGKDMDAVSVVTPDHTHFVAAIHAMSMGKHVYVEKPLAHSFNECEMLMRAEKKFGVVTQMGNQGHSSGGAEQTKQVLKAGLLDDVYKIEAWMESNTWYTQADKRISTHPPEDPLPETFSDWDLWCGPQKVLPFSKKYHPGGWRAFHQYGCGLFGDWGCHIIDFAHDYLNLGLPTTINPIELGDHNKIIFPMFSHIQFKFPKRGPKMPEVELIWKAGQNPRPVIEEKYGDKQEDGSIKPPSLDFAGTVMHRKQGDYLITRGHHSAASRLSPREVMLEHAESIKAPRRKFGHGASFVQACMGNTTTESPFSVAAPLTQVLNLGIIAEYLNQDLKFDPKRKQFIGNDEANALLSGPAPRKEWAHYYRMV